MKIALIWANDKRLADTSVRFELYQEGLNALGHEVFSVCRRGAEEGFSCPVKTFDDFCQLAAPEFWRSLQADLALMITWNGMVDYLDAADTAGQRVIAIADADGQASVRLFFWPRFRRDWFEQPLTILGKLHLLWYYFKLYLWKWREEDAVFVRSTELSERVLFATEGARHNFSRCLALHGRDDLIAKLAVSPYPLDPSFLAANPSETRQRRAVAIGRWDDPQKNGSLLAEAIMRYYDDGGDWETVAVGIGGEAPFAKLVRRHKKFRYLGTLSASRIAELLGRSRVLLCSSRWESGPIVVFEALAAGCTLVTTPLPVTPSVIDNGRNGTCSASHRPLDFVRAMRTEFSAWDGGLRSTHAVSQNWCEQLQPRRICKDLLRGI